MTIKIKSSGIKPAAIAKTSTRRGALRAEVTIDARASSGGRNDLLPALQIETVPVDRLRPANRRVRQTAPDQLRRVMGSLQRFGMVRPVLISADGAVIDGHIVLEAARRIGLREIACIRVDHLGDDEVRALSITLNNLGEKGEWDLEALRLEAIDLIAADFEMEVLGFSAVELDIILLDPEPIASADEEEAVPDAGPVVSRPGDLWLLGPHRILCADSLKHESYALLMGRAKASAVFTDQPYNIPIKGFVSGLGKTIHKDFAMGVGEMSDEEFVAFTRTFLEHCTAVLEPNSPIFACIDWRGIEHVMRAAREIGLKLVNMAVWNKGSGGMGSLYRSAHELIPLFVNGDAIATNNVELGVHGRDRTNVWDYPGANRRGSSAADALGGHPTPKPIELVADALLDVTQQGDIVLDPFLGSGTTLLAAEKTQRIAHGLELEPRYVDLAIRRWQAMTGEIASLVDGTPFDDVLVLREADSR